MNVAHRNMISELLAPRSGNGRGAAAATAD
jgi:hypothetical protein